VNTENDDILSPDDIEKLLADSGSASPPEQQGQSAPKQSDQSEQESSASTDEEQPANAGSEGAEINAQPSDRATLSSGDIESLLHKQSAQHNAFQKPPTTNASPSPEEILNQAEADLAAAIAPDLAKTGLPPVDLENASPLAFENFEPAHGNQAGAMHLEALQDVELDLRIELGRAELLIDEVTKLREGSVVPLDKLAGDPVDILVNGRLIARGEVLVLNDNFCVRVAEILTPDF